MVGDQYLRELALLLQNVAKSLDIEVARLGGDEFVCILKNTAEDEAAKLAETIRAQIEDLTITSCGAQIELSASFGVASFILNHDRALSELFALADQALYKAK